jgi:hypothetical protein
MPFYDVQRSTSTNGSANTESSHLWGTTVANQEPVSIIGAYAAARFATAGGGQLRIKDNTGTVASGGTAQVPTPKNRRSAPAAQSAWKSDASAITAGTTLVIRATVGFAVTGGMGGYVAPTPQGAIQMMPNATNPIDVEITSLAAQAAVPIDITVDISEGNG